uniref:28S ribosomal protein S14, mitochondrial n=1 Tax=Scapholeberis mucronata TaxID=202097 RepID=A0A4Y7NL90_9CRUS|nr:EOG090X0MNX [Scapholeberis mucronata]SVE94038.1 EOG090X0MNX [Scapholeberis mucronata]
MATIINRLLRISFCKIIVTDFSNEFQKNVIKNDQPSRSNWTDWRMMKDNKRRKLVVEHAAERIRMKAIQKNDILPAEITEIGHQMLAAKPRDSNPIRMKNRCAITSRPRGVVTRWRLSRIVWRSLADYNKLSGVQRAMW